MPAHRPLRDPRSPYVLDLRELGRRAGSMRRIRMRAPAPAGLRVEMAGVPPAAEIGLDLRLEAVMEGVLVSGTVHAPVDADCSRCLDPVAVRLEVEIQQLFLYPGDDVTEDEDVGYVEDDRVDLAPALRDAVVLALPLAPRCRDDCPGLCATCGVRLADVPADHAHDAIDPRWAALAAMYDNRAIDQDQES